MAFKDILAVARSSRQKSVLAVSVALAADWGAARSMLHVIELPAPVTEPFGEAICKDLCETARERAGEQTARIAELVIDGGYTAQ